MSVNNSELVTSVKGRPRRILTSEMRMWQDEFHSLLSSVQGEFDAFAKEFDENKHVLLMNHYYFMPVKEIMTCGKVKRIKKRRFDLCNLQKRPNDVICAHLGIDDALICMTNVRKLVSPTNEHFMMFEIEKRSVHEVTSMSEAYEEVILDYY